MSSPNLKELALGILTAILSIAAFWFWHGSVALAAEGNFTEYLRFIPSVAGLIVAAIFFSLGAIFIKNAKLIYGTAAISVGAPFFFVSATQTALAVLGLCLIVIFLAVQRIRNEFYFSLGFSVSKILKSGLPLFFTASALIIATYQFSTISEEKAISALLPKSVFNTTLKLMGKPLEDITGLPLGNSNSTVDEVLTKVIKEGLENQGISLSQIAESELERLISVQRNQLAKNFGLTLKGSEEIKDVFYNSISARLTQLLDPYKSYLPYASALTFFLAFKTFTLPLYYFSMLITYVLIRLMIATNILRVEKEQMEVERLTL